MGYCSDAVVAGNRIRVAMLGRGGRCELDETSTRVHLHAVAQGNWRKQSVLELCGMGVSGALSSGVQPPGLQDGVGAVAFRFRL